MKRHWPVVIVLCVAGCTKPLEVSSITEIKANHGATGIDVYEPKRRAGQTAVPDFAGDQLLEVRTYADTEGDGRQEISGASCSLSAADFAATMQSPAKVRVPLYRGQSSVLSVSCQKPGYRTRSITVEAFDAVRAARYHNGSTNGVIGLVVASAFDAAADNTKNEWRYPLAAITLEPEATHKAQ